MKRLVYFILISLILFLTGCTSDTVVQGNSIEDCIKVRVCHYDDKDVRTEGSDLANQLSVLILNNEDSYYFSYNSDYEGKAFILEYDTNLEFSEANLSLVVNVLNNSEEIINSLYNVNQIRKSIVFNDLIVVNIDSTGYKSVEFRTNIQSGYGSVMNYLIGSSITIIKILDSDMIGSIVWYNGDDGFINLEVKDTYIEVTCQGVASDQGIQDKIADLLDNYTLQFITD